LVHEITHFWLKLNSKAEYRIGAVKFASLALDAGVIEQNDQQDGHDPHRQGGKINLGSAKEQVDGLGDLVAPQAVIADEIATLAEDDQHRLPLMRPTMTELG
jgi:hypothetical protein